MRGKTRLKRRLAGIGTILISISSLNPVTCMASVGNIVVNQKPIVFTESTGSPLIIEGRMYVPLRTMGEALGLETSWDATSQRITLTDEYMRMNLEIGNPIAMLNGQRTYIDERDKKPILTTYPIIEKGRTYVPLRFIAESVEAEVSFEMGTTYMTIKEKNEMQSPISPWQYQALLGRGMDVDWSKTSAGQAYYKVQAVKDFKAAGVSHVRIRIKDEADEQLFTYLDAQIKDCLDNGLIPIIAYQGDELKNNPTQKNIDQVIRWWKKVAARYKDYSYLLSFDVLIEVTDALSKEPDLLNMLYESVVTEIRKTNPTRIIMISPRLRSDAAYLKELRIPTKHNNYLMAEWHFYAAGPSKENARKLWTVGTEEEKNLIREKIALALEWQQVTGIPTWVGAWMPGNYNDGNDYSIEEQVTFATFMTEALSEAKIPFAVNSDTKFYDRVTNSWVSNMLPVRKVIWCRGDE